MWKSAKKPSPESIRKGGQMFDYGVFFNILQRLFASGFNMPITEK
jgi:hypothetical protein